MFNIVWDGNTISVSPGREGFRINWTENYQQNRSAAGYIEHISIYGLMEFSCDYYLTEANYRQMSAWWAWARTGRTWSFVNTVGNDSSTLLDGTAASGQKVIPLTATTGLTAGDECLIRAVDQDFEFEIIKIASVSAGVSVTAEDNLYFSYAADDLFRHYDYVPYAIILENHFQPIRPTHLVNYRGAMHFAEDLGVIDP